MCRQPKPNLWALYSMEWVLLHFISKTFTKGLEKENIPVLLNLAFYGQSACLPMLSVSVSGQTINKTLLHFSKNQSSSPVCFSTGVWWWALMSGVCVCDTQVCVCAWHSGVCVRDTQVCVCVCAWHSGVCVCVTMLCVCVRDTQVCVWMVSGWLRSGSGLGVFNCSPGSWFLPVVMDRWPCYASQAHSNWDPLVCTRVAPSHWLKWVEWWQDVLESGRVVNNEWEEGVSEVFEKNESRLKDDKHHREMRYNPSTAVKFHLYTFT